MKIMIIMITVLFSAGAVASSKNCKVYLPSECLEVLDFHVSSSELASSFRDALRVRVQVSVKCKVEENYQGVPYKGYHFIKIMEHPINNIGVDFLITDREEGIYSTSFICESYQFGD